MADVQELLDALRDSFYRRCKNDRQLKEIAEKLDHGTYTDAHDYSVRIGEILSESFADVLTEDIYPDLTEEMARQLIPSLLGSGHRMTSDACVSVQTNLNKNAGLGLKPIEPEFDVGRAYDLADKYVGYDEWKKARWVLGEPVENFMQSVPDDAIRRNADFQWRSGMSPKIIRKAEPGACKWCRALAGTYDYADVRDTGNDVYRRHENCRCIVEYDPGDGTKQDVWSKTTYRGDDPEARKEALTANEERIARESARKQAERTSRAAAVERIQKELGYSPKGASIWYNQNKKWIDRYGLDYVLDADRNSRQLRPMANGPRRAAQSILTSQEIDQILRYADEMSIPQDVLVFNEGGKTGFLDDDRLIYIRGDIFPADYAENPNSILSARAALAHEYYGHYLHYPSRFEIGTWRDEFEASYTAALNAPGLTDQDWRLLMLDAFERAQNAGISVRYNRKARELIYGYDE